MGQGGGEAGHGELRGTLWEGGVMIRLACESAVHIIYIREQLVSFIKLSSRLRYQIAVILFS